MITFDEYRQMDAIAIAQCIRSRQVTAIEILECAITRAEEVNPKINAIIYPMYDQARLYLTKNKGMDSQGILFGVPFLLKDLYVHWAGTPTSNGSALFRNRVASYTSGIVQRWADLGLVFMGKTNTPEFGLLATTEPACFGATKNPWDLSYSAGGSSGGSAAAVAAGIVPIASAADFGGSIRIPASCCGLFGLKPSRGLISASPYPDVWSDTSTCHIVSRSVRDSEMVLKQSMGLTADDINAGISGGNAIDFDNKKKLTVGFSTESPFGGVVASECREAVEHAAGLLAQLGHHVEEASPSLDGESVLQCYLDCYIANVHAELASEVSELGLCQVRKQVEPFSLFLYWIGTRFPAGHFLNSRKKWSELSRCMSAFHLKYDVWLTPISATPNFELGTMDHSAIEGVFMGLANRLGWSKYIKPEALYRIGRPQMNKAPFTQIANLTGQPAMSMPLHWHRGLPIGVQFVAWRHQDNVLLTLARQLEAAFPWFDNVATIKTTA